MDAPLAEPVKLADPVTLGLLLRLVTHDLRNPLAVIISNLGYLGNVLSPAGTDVQETLADTLTSSEDLKHIIENLDLLGQTLAGAQNLTPRAFAIGPLTQDIVGRCAAFASSHGVKIQAFVADAGAVAQVQSVPELYERALTNVLRNAIAHSPQGAEVSVVLQLQGTEARVAVRDRGTPLDRTQPTRMFEPAGQLAAKTELVGRYSRGLGLMSAKLAAVAAGLELSIAPAEDGFTNVFQLVFRRA